MHCLIDIQYKKNQNINGVIFGLQDVHPYPENKKSFNFK